jgi:hypothetical protein
MNIALVLQHKLLLGMQRLLMGVPTPVQSVPSVARRMGSRALPVAATLMQPQCDLRSAGDTPTQPARAVAAKVMPLRVLRVLESGQPRSCAGRLVISGRMADVCAELDRLVEREAALH